MSEKISLDSSGLDSEFSLLQFGKIVSKTIRTSRCLRIDMQYYIVSYLCFTLSRWRKIHYLQSVIVQYSSIKPT